MAKQIKTKISAGEEYEFLDVNDKPMFTITINPTDLDLINRANDLIEYLNNMGGDDDGDPLDQIAKAKEEIAKRLNALFNTDIATPIFAVMSPFTPQPNGQTYIEVIIDKLTDIIESELNTRIKKVQSRMNKYTAKYHK